MSRIVTIILTIIVTFDIAIIVTIITNLLEGDQEELCEVGNIPPLRPRTQKQDSTLIQQLPLRQ